jgi:hypothetical protein
MSNLSLLSGARPPFRNAVSSNVAEVEDCDETSLLQNSRQRSELRAPALVLLAIACILEGYARLGEIGSPHFVRGSLAAGLFAAVSLAAIRLAGGSTTGRLVRLLDGSLRAVQTLLVAATVVVIVLPRPTSSITLGASDLLVALGVLASVALGERCNAREGSRGCCQAQPIGRCNHTGVDDRRQSCGKWFPQNAVTPR